MCRCEFIALLVCWLLAACRAKYEFQMIVVVLVINFVLRLPFKVHLNKLNCDICSYLFSLLASLLRLLE